MATTPDSSGHEYQDATAQNVTQVEGRWGKGFDFANPNARMRVELSAELEPNRVTVVLWVKATVPPDDDTYLLGKSAQGCGIVSYGMEVEGGNPHFVIYDHTALRASPSAPGAEVWDGAWHMLAGSFDGEFLRMYLDGEELPGAVPAEEAIEWILETTDLAIGNLPNDDCTGYGYAGQLDEVRVYGRALTADEVRALADPAAQAPPELARRPEAAVAPGRLVPVAGGPGGDPPGQPGSPTGPPGPPGKTPARPPAARTCARRAR